MVCTLHQVSELKLKVTFRKELIVSKSIIPDEPPRLKVPLGGPIFKVGTNLKSMQ